ncbi:iron ABC transporter substrate-binding protein [Methanocalculus taiwanensis]|uniref:Iron ABC transporter substrate-binding protein n=1 Tax=Methanocalculus taiwanensis TaxID=106207 RepID=A0ABD4TG56_9EURY|nr:iron ABC transporter substrate-binding protein [Methanocalculus taiwanensis]MCQ1537491.1 iron ABC transporter substrate-binding protein [Methanocalculus taiwanensis]
MNSRILIILCGAVLLSLLAVAGCTTDAGTDQTTAGSEITITDGFGRSITVPSPVESILCSGSGGVRYAVYLESVDRITGVDSQDKNYREIEGRPYALIHRDHLMTLPLFGELRGKDDPEKVIAIAPDLVFKTGSTGTSYATSGPEADLLQQKTGVPVVAFPYGSLRNDDEKREMYDGLRLMGAVLGKEARAEAVIAYIEATMADLESRTGDIPAADQKRVYIGGVSSAGAHGIISTEPAYPPFLWVHADNVAAGLGPAHADVAKEAIVDWDPEYIFIDVNTMTSDDEGAIGQLKHDPALKGLTAVKEGRVYGVLPYNFYNVNHGTVLADAYFIGKVLYPDRFADIDPSEKADEIYSFLLGAPAFELLNSQYGNLGFSQIPI